MKINVGKWLRRQAFGGQPVTLGNAARLALGRLGYDTDSRVDIVRLLDDVVQGRLTPDDVVAAIGYEGLRALDADCQADLRAAGSAAALEREGLDGRYPRGPDAGRAVRGN